MDVASVRESKRSRQLSATQPTRMTLSEFSGARFLSLRRLHHDVLCKSVDINSTLFARQLANMACLTRIIGKSWQATIKIAFSRTYHPRNSLGQNRIQGLMSRMNSENVRTSPALAQVSSGDRHRLRLACLWLGLMVLALVTLAPSAGWAQGEDQLNIAEGLDDFTDTPSTNSAANTVQVAAGEHLNLLTLLTKGGVLMIPIMGMSILVIALVIERFFSLRDRKVLPKAFVAELGVLASSNDGFDPKQAYRVCQAFPSSASTVIRSMLLKVGRPQAEVERAVSEASDREASRLYGNVRWLNLVAAVAPLIGLFGTVWGMIQAFFQTTQLTAGQNKSLFLAEGIYVALVTTLGGLAVAIPAAIFSHYFEGRIQSLFYQIDELLFNLMPQIERFEGRLRMSRRDLGADAGLPQQHPEARQKPPAAARPVQPSQPQQ